MRMAKDKIQQDYGHGLFLGVHGHGFTNHRHIQVGYLIDENDLALSNTELDTNRQINASSIKNLVRNNIQGLSHSALLRGEQAFGTILENSGLHSIPSLQAPEPYTEIGFFEGGYNLAIYGSRDGGSLDGIQVELHRDDREAPKVSAEKITDALILYIDKHYNNRFIGSYCNLLNEDSILEFMPAILSKPRKR